MLSIRILALSPRGFSSEHGGEYLICSLQERKAIEWHDAVDIIYGDMRSINIPEQADIMISELLGSFGDNELSPECLDVAKRFLKRRFTFQARGFAKTA